MINQSFQRKALFSLNSLRLCLHSFFFFNLSVWFLRTGKRSREDSSEVVFSHLTCWFVSGVVLFCFLWLWMMFPLSISVRSGSFRSLQLLIAWFFSDGRCICCSSHFRVNVQMGMGDSGEIRVFLGCSCRCLERLFLQGFLFRCWSLSVKS